MPAAIGIIWNAFRAYARHRCASFAAAFAYYTLFALGPLLLFIVSVSGHFMNNKDRNSIVRFVVQRFPVSAADVQRQVTLATRGRAGLSILGLVLALWSLSSVFGAVRNGIEAIWGDQHRRTWIIGKLRDLVAVFGLIVVLAIPAALTAFVLRSGQPGQLNRILLSLAPLPASWLLFAVLYRWMAPAPLDVVESALGAIVAAVGVQALNIGTQIYFRYFGAFDRVNGPLSAAIGILLYAYLIGSLILVGAEITHECWARRHARAVNSSPFVLADTVA